MQGVDNVEVVKINPLVLSERTRNETLIVRKS